MESRKGCESQNGIGIGIGWASAPLISPDQTEVYFGKKTLRARRGWGPARHLEVPVHNAQAMKVGDSPEDLPYKVAGILLCVGAPLHDAVKQFTTGHPEDRRKRQEVS